MLTSFIGTLAVDLSFIRNSTELVVFVKERSAVSINPLMRYNASTSTMLEDELTKLLAVTVMFFFGLETNRIQ